MRFHTMRIPCRDLGDSERFYSAQLGLTKAFGDAGSGYIGYRLDNATLLLELAEAGEYECGGFLGFSLEVDDIHAFYRACVARDVAFSGPPETQPWGGIMTHITDCNGNTFSIVNTAGQ